MALQILLVERSCWLPSVAYCALQRCPCMLRLLHTRDAEVPLVSPVPLREFELGLEAHEATTCAHPLRRVLLLNLGPIDVLATQLSQQ